MNILDYKYENIIIDNETPLYQFYPVNGNIILPPDSITKLNWTIAIKYSNVFQVNIQSLNSSSTLDYYIDYSSISYNNLTVDANANFNSQYFNIQPDENSNINTLVNNLVYEATDAICNVELYVVTNSDINQKFRLFATLDRSLNNIEDSGYVFSTCKYTSRPL